MPISPQEVIANLGELPPLPQVAAQVLRLAADPDASMDELQRVISTDQALASQILKISNSAMFGMMREVKTLTQAIMTLGFSTIKSVVIASSAKNLYGRGSGGFQERLLWEHALVAALAGRAFGREIRYFRTEEVFLAALMHDIGKSVMSIKFPERYGALVKTVYNEQGDFLELELETFGFDHAMVGEALLVSWNLAQNLSEAVRWHHDPLQAAPDNRVLASLVALGNQTALDKSIGVGLPSSVARATEESLQILNLTPDQFESHRESVLEALEMDKALIREL